MKNKNINLILRGIKTLFQMDKVYVLQNIFISFISPIGSYINIYVSALIIDKLIAKDTDVWYAVVGILLFNALFSVFISFISRKKDLRFSTYFQANERMLRAEKSMRMRYDLLESNSVHMLCEHINGANQNGFNLNYFNIFLSRLVSSISNIVYSIVLMSGLLFSGEFPIVLKLIVIFGASAVIVLKYFVSEKAQKLGFEMNNKLIKHNILYNYYSELCEDYQSGKDTRLFHLESYIFDTYKKAMADGNNVIVDTKKKTLGYNQIADISMNVLTAVLYVCVITGCVLGSVTVGGITKYIRAVTTFIGTVGALLSQYKSLVYNNKYMEKYFEYLDLENGEDEGELEITKNGNLGYSVSFENVSFRYPGTDNLVLKDVSFTIEPGKKAALVGLNGSGKTTIVKLLCRLYKPDSGKILLNGKDIWDYDLADYVKHMGVVFQDFKLFAFTLSENLSAGEPIDHAFARECLEKCGFGERLNTLPDGVDTYLYRNYDDNGIEISGGEAQKVALARAVYRKPECVILDEPTAALDPIAEYDIYSKFKEIIDGNTAVYISHRLSSCRFCDVIFVISDGKIAEIGSHDELVSRDGGIYSEMWNSQAQFYVN